MSNAESKPSVCELTAEELDRVSGGGKKGATNDPLPTEAITLVYGGIIYSFSLQRT